VLEQLAEVFTSIVGTSYEEYNRKVLRLRPRLRLRLRLRPRLRLRLRLRPRLRLRLRLRLSEGYNCKVAARDPKPNST
jgi:hypothetical protein